MFGLGMPEILLILAIALIVIGPQQLPEIAKTLGRAIKEFKHSAQDLKQSINIDEKVINVSSPDLKTSTEQKRNKTTSVNDSNVDFNSKTSSTESSGKSSDDKTSETAAASKITEESIDPDKTTKESEK